MALYIAAALLPTGFAHEFLSVPPARTDVCKLNAVVFGSTICKKGGDDVQCLDDPLMYSHLFHEHSAYANNACGGSIQVRGADGSTQGLLQRCGDISTDPQKFDMSIAGPEEITEWTAGSEVDLRVHGFFHQGVNRVAMCFFEDSDCSKPSDFNKYILGYHFTEGVAGDESAPEGIYSCDMPIKVKLPNRNGRAVFQWLVDAEDVRSYVSCSDVTLSGASPDGPPADAYSCNGHPLCNCTTVEPANSDTVGLHRTCPQGTAPSTVSGQATGTDIVKQYKDQVGTEEFCRLCLTDGCPSTCGGKFNGFYQGAKCTNTPVLPGCGNVHESGLPQYLDCTSSTCSSSGWAPSPQALLV